MGLGIWTAIKVGAGFLTGSGGGGGDKPRPIDMLAEGIDKFTYTEQEKAANGKAALDSYVDYIKSTNDENSERSVARRKLALQWMSVQFRLIYVWLLCLAGEAVWPATLDATGKVLTPSRIHVVTEGVVLINKMWWVGTLMVLVFFFGAHTLRSTGLVGGKKK